MHLYVKLAAQKQSRRCEGVFVGPEEHFGPLVAAQAAPGLETVNSRGGTLGNISFFSACCAAYNTSWRAGRQNTVTIIIIGMFVKSLKH